MKYRSFKKAYGGDPDSSILQDLHKRVMRLEIDRIHDREIIRALQAFRDRFLLPEHKNIARDERVGGSEIPPPPQD